MLTALGLTKDEALIYVELVRQGPSRIDQLPGLCGLSAERIDASLAGLSAQGLVSHAAGCRSRVIASPPDIAGEALLQRRTHELRTAHVALGQLAAEYRTAVLPLEAELLPVEFAPDEVVAQRIDQIQRKAREEVLMFDLPPYVSQVDDLASLSNDRELEQLAAGINYRTVYDRRALDGPGGLTRIRRYVEAGEDARSAPRLPMKLVIVDRELAVLPTPGDGAGAGTGCVMVRPSPLLDGLVALFEQFWATALPLTPVAGSKKASSPELDAADVQLLTLLLSGMTDEGIARQLGLGRRTVLRRARALMDRAGAATRMQLGWYAARRGWIGETRESTEEGGAEGRVALW
ncbi:helix-turn-helix domain-containing protein [Streptomyces sp. NPDC057580]|uniref:helix-turn-helix domain-containing protein n=1 Tax=Streptomyces sp. NPDC057580 TaxID=3346173 RepID=UPI0036A32B7E